ncbi:unnamed protein product [Scytosiphon promiscuus]
MALMEEPPNVIYRYIRSYTGGWTVGAYVIMRGSVDLYVLESRGPAAMLPTAASQEDLATKACRGQPMYHPRPPAEWEAADGAAEASGGGLNTWMDAGIPGRRRQRAITEHFEAALSGSGSGPRRAHTRNLAPSRWKACRLGVGALFGDRAVLASNEAARRSSLGTQAPRPRSTPASVPGHLAGPALETAITAEETEMLEIGTVSYRRHLAAGVRERLDHAVTLLRASGSMDGVPTPALGRICRYATERTAGPNLVDAAHPPLLNPPAGGAAQTETPPAPLESMVDGSKGQGSNAGATFRGTVFFVAEGEGEVSLLAATAFGDRRALQKRRKSRRRRDKNVRDSGSGSPGGTCCGFSLKDGCGDDSGSAGRGGMSVGSGRAETIEGQILSPTVLFPPNGGHDYALATTTATAGATSHRHGIGDNHDTSAPASSLASKIAATTARAAAIAAAAHTLHDRCDVEETVTSRRARLITNAEPVAITAESLDLPAPEFPGLHMASLVAGPGGLRCVTVGLAVLQKICPPVHRRLARTASERYSGWLAEARRRNEDEWQESLENESVRSLSRSFYDSFSKGCCSGSGISDMGSSVGWTSSACGRDGGGNTSIGPGFFEDDAHSNGDETATVQAAELPIVSPSHRQHMPTDLFQSKSIFELRGRYVELASCSSAHSVVPVRLGRALPARVPSSPGQNRHLRRPVPPPPQANASTNKTGNGAGGKRAGRRVRPGANTAVKMIQRVIRRHCSASAPTGSVGGGGDGKGQANDFSSGSPRSPETTTHGYLPADESHGHSQARRRSSSPTRADDTGSGHAPSNVDRDHGPSANAFTYDPRTTDHGHNMGAEVSIGDEHLGDCRADDTDGSLTSRGPADGSGGADGEGCRRGRLCGTSPCTCASTSLDHPGTGQGPEVVTILERYTHLETYDCPVSPFSAPPSWADVPPLVTLEPPGFSRTSKSPAHDPSAMESGGRDEQWGGRKERHREGTGAEDPPLSFPPRKEDRIATATTRPAEKTVFQIISSGRRMSYGWGWTRPSGERGGRKRRTGKGRVGAGSSPSLVGRERRGRTNVHVSAFPPTS